MINGEDAPNGRYPYVVSLQSLDSLHPVCVGTLVAPDVVVTAARCAREAFVIRTNPNSLSVPNANSELFASQQRRIHPFYSHPFSVQLGAAYHDVMLIKLNGTSIHPYIRIDTTGASALFENTLTMGWGSIVGDGFPFQEPSVLQQTTMTEIDSETCTNLYLNEVPFLALEGNVETLLCMQGLNTTICDGDTGMFHSKCKDDDVSATIDSQLTSLHVVIH